MAEVTVRCSPQARAQQQQQQQQGGLQGGRVSNGLPCSGSRDPASFINWVSSSLSLPVLHLGWCDKPVTIFLHLILHRPLFSSNLVPCLSPHASIPCPFPFSTQLHHPSGIRTFGLQAGASTVISAGDPSSLWQGLGSDRRAGLGLIPCSPFPTRPCTPPPRPAALDVGAFPPLAPPGFLHEPQ